MCKAVGRSPTSFIARREWQKFVGSAWEQHHSFLVCWLIFWQLIRGPPEMLVSMRPFRIFGARFPLRLDPATVFGSGCEDVVVSAVVYRTSHCHWRLQCNFCFSVQVVNLEKPTQAQQHKIQFEAQLLSPIYTFIPLVKALIGNHDHGLLGAPPDAIHLGLLENRHGTRKPVCACASIQLIERIYAQELCRTLLEMQPHLRHQLVRIMEAHHIDEEAKPDV